LEDVLSNRDKGEGYILTGQAEVLGELKIRRIKDGVYGKRR
jgi:hypothetical protein